tara:strand:+ start:2247 stop:2408 length:162 start_codon:yes stop_codon:yes gene_type:complete
MDYGDVVNAQFRTKNKNIDLEVSSKFYYEYYHIVDGKVNQSNSFKKSLKKVKK